MDKFVARLNIEHLRKQIAEERDETKRRTLLSLLTDEETKLEAALKATPKGKPEKR